MSITNATTIECGRCRVPIDVYVAASLNVERHPELRAQLLAGALHRFECPHCHGALLVDAHLVYFDMPRRQCFFVFPRARLREVDACIAEARSAYELGFGEIAPRGLQTLGEELMVRVCFGLGELRDKIVADEAGLSDLALEELKCEVLAAREDLRARQVLGLSLVSVTADALELAGEAVDGARASRIRVPRQLYDDIAARGHEAIRAARPELVRGPHVSMLRVLLDPG